MNRILDLHPYRAGVLVSVADTDKQFENAVKRAPDGKEYWEGIKGVTGATNLAVTSAKFFGLPQGDGIIRIARLKTPSDHGRALHEVMHCVFHILRVRGLPLCDESEEAYTYLAQHLYEEILAMK